MVRLRTIIGKFFYHRKIAIPEEFQDGALDYDFAYEFVQLKGQDGKPIDAVYPKTYSLNNVYAQEQVFDGQTYYYLGYLYKYKKDSEDLLYFTVDENSGSYQTKTAYKYKYDSFNKSGTFNSYKFYLYNPYHSEVIEKPMMTYSGKKLDFEDAISTESVTEDGESVKYGVANYPLTDSNYANSAYTFSINFRNVGNDNLTYSYSNTQYNVGNGAVGISDSDASGWISFDMDNERVTITPQVSNPEALKSFSTYVTVTDGWFVARAHITANITRTSAPDITQGDTQNFRVYKTGVTASTTAGDDGAYEKGTAKDFTKSGNIVTNNVSGLQWQDDAAAALTNVDWTGAGTYCDGLTLDTFSDWRLPTIQELTTIIDYGTRDPALVSAFTNTSSSYYWSSTEAQNTANAYGVGIFEGDDKYLTKKTDLWYARCVRQ